MKHNKTATVILAGLVSFGVSAASLADSYHLYINNQTQDIFTMKKGFATVGTLDVGAEQKHFEFDVNDNILFTSNSLPRLSVKYDSTNQSPKCADLFQGYSCNFLKKASNNYELTIQK